MLATSILLSGFIPLSLKSKQQDITYCIYASNTTQEDIVELYKVKKQIIEKYKEIAMSNYKQTILSIEDRIDEFSFYGYKATYINNEICCLKNNKKGCCLKGILYTVKDVNDVSYKYYFDDIIRKFS